jgi:hypothetical protein
VQASHPSCEVFEEHVERWRVPDLGELPADRVTVIVDRAGRVIKSAGSLLTRSGTVTGERSASGLQTGGSARGDHDRIVGHVCPDDLEVITPRSQR